MGLILKILIEFLSVQFDLFVVKVTHLELPIVSNGETIENCQILLNTVDSRVIYRLKTNFLPLKTVNQLVAQEEYIMYVFLILDIVSFLDSAVAGV